MSCESEGAVPPQKLEAGTCAAGEASTGAARKGLESLRLGAEPTFSFVYELSEARTASLSIEAAAAAYQSSGRNVPPSAPRRANLNASGEVIAAYEYGRLRVEIAAPAVARPS